MEPSRPDYIDDFVLELLRTGLMLSELAADLIEARSGEEPATGVIEMMCGTIRTALEPIDPLEVRRATELIDLAATRTIEHLRLACELSRHMHREGGEARRAFG